MSKDAWIRKEMIEEQQFEKMIWAMLERNSGQFFCHNEYISLDSKKKMVQEIVEDFFNDEYRRRNIEEIGK